jgi:hypothetical protein
MWRITHILLPLIALALTVLSPSAVYGQEGSQVSPIPYGEGYGPTYWNELLPVSYSHRYLSMRQVDFRNLGLRNGHYEKKGRGVFESRDLDSVEYLSPPTADPEYALVQYSEFSAGGSSSQDIIAKLFRLSHHHLEVAQEIGWDTHFHPVGPYEFFDPKTKILTIRTSHYLPGDAHCCVSATDVVTFQWNGTHFIQKAVSTELSEYGKSEGTVLPITRGDKNR